MTQLETFTSMFALQQKLNDDTNGTQWIQGTTKNDRTINWLRCIYMETAEAIDSLNWKHWKNIDSPDDIENLKIELVDIWHFVMSQLIVDYGLSIAAQVASDAYTAALDDKMTSTIDLLETILKESVNAKVPTVSFFITLKRLNMDVSTLYALYVGKNCLNAFRQNNGYKEGKYIKIWNGKEDNVYMQELLAQEALSYEALYAKLQAKYDTL